MNLVVLMGNLTRDPEFTETQSGKQVCKFSIAVSRDFEEGTDFFNCTAWGKQAENINKYFCKGKKILIKGRIKVTDSERDGTKKRFFDIIVNKFDFCSNKEVTDGQQEDDYVNESQSSVAPVSGPPLPTVTSRGDDNGLPF
jgi:single-strand DNA-binding protein